MPPFSESDHRFVLDYDIWPRLLSTLTEAEGPRFVSLPVTVLSEATASSPGRSIERSHSILAVDLGTVTGWAIRLSGNVIESGTISFRPSRYDGGGMRYLRFRVWLDDYGGLLATLTSWCEQSHIAYQGVPVGTIKKFIAGKGNADKHAVINAVRARGHDPADDNEADAIAILLWSIEMAGGVR